jgi:hypothetical protein
MVAAHFTKPKLIKSYWHGIDFGNKYIIRTDEQNIVKRYGTIDLTLTNTIGKIGGSRLKYCCIMYQLKKG